MSIAFKPCRLLPCAGAQLQALPQRRGLCKGEVNFVVKEKSTVEALLRVRALIIEYLAVECSGGQTFHYDNTVFSDASKNCVSMHDSQYMVSPKTKNVASAQPPPTHDLPGPKAGAASMSTTSGTLLMELERVVLPAGVYLIPTPGKPATSKTVLVLPPSHRTPTQRGPRWKPQMCDVARGMAM